MITPSEAIWRVLSYGKSLITRLRPSLIKKLLPTVERSCKHKYDQRLVIFDSVNCPV